MYLGLHVKYRYSCQITKKINFSRQFSKNTQTSNLMEVHPVGAELLHADVQTDRQIDRRADRQVDMTKLIVAFS